MGLPLDIDAPVTADVFTVVAATQEHGRNLHNMDVTREEALAMASEVDD